MTECFIVMSDEIEGRINPFYYKPYFFGCIKDLKKSKFDILKLKDICIKITDGTHFTPKYKPKGIQFLSVKDVRENKISFDNTKFISQIEHEKLIKRCKPEAEDILLTKVGTVGLSAVIPKNAPEFSIFVSVALLKINKIKANPHYVTAYLNSKFTKFQIERVLKGIGVPDLHLEDIAKLKIPLPSLEIQNKIVQLMDKAYSSKKSKEIEALKLLDSINDYVLDELGIKLPELKDKMTYVVGSEEVKNNRVDAYYFQPKFNEIEKAVNKGKFDLIKIGDKLDLLNQLGIFKNISEINYVDLSSIDKSSGYIIKTKNMLVKDAPSRAKQKIKKGDLLVSSLSGSLKSISVYDKEYQNSVASTGFHIIKDSELYNNYYLFALFRTPLFQSLIQRQTTGAIMSAINRDSFKNIKIPLPPLQIQNKIAEEVKKRMQKAEQLQKEAKEELKKAKQEVEEIILGN